MERIATALLRIVRHEVVDAGGRRRPVTLVVSHGGAMAVGVTALCALDTRFVSTHLLANCQVVELVRGDDGRWTCVAWAGERPPVRG